ncbi:MAG TPA: NADH-quinone oxidoreductase subunit J [bacterium]
MNISFYIFGALAIMGAVMLLFQKNPVSAALSLLLVLISTACIYILLGAHLLAFLQIILYAGAIMVLFVIAITIIPMRESDLNLIKSPIAKLLAIPAGIILIWELISVGRSFNLQVPFATSGSDDINALSMLIFDRFALQFELISLLLLTGIVGAILIAKRRL